MPKITTTKIAELAGVSQTTVSAVLNNNSNIKISAQTKAKVLSAAKQLGYKTFNDTGYSGLIAIFIPTLNNPYYAMIIEYCESLLYGQNYFILLCNTHRHTEIEHQLLNMCISKKVDGIIYAFTPTITETINQATTYTPLVVIGDIEENISADVIGLNSIKAGEMIADHLVKLGHTNIAYVSGPTHSFSLSRQTRLQGIKNYMHRCNLLSNLNISIYNNEHDSSDNIFELEVGYKLTKELLKSNPRPTAIIAANDMTAVGTINAIHEMNLSVPEDISVCGFDNIMISENISPKLTTIDHCLQMRCKQAISILLERKKGIDNSGSYKIVYDPILVVRNSTGKPKE